MASNVTNTDVDVANWSCSRVVEWAREQFNEDVAQLLKVQKLLCKCIHIAQVYIANEAS